MTAGHCTRLSTKLLVRLLNHTRLRDKSGCLLADATDIEGRWVEHYTELLSAQPMTEEPTGRGECCETFEPGLTVEFEDMFRRVNKLNQLQASGTDWISAELLQAGGGHTARHIMSIGRTMVNSGKWVHSSRVPGLPTFPRRKVMNRRWMCGEVYRLVARWPRF